MGKRTRPLTEKELQWFKEQAVIYEESSRVSMLAARFFNYLLWIGAAITTILWWKNETRSDK